MGTCLYFQQGILETEQKGCMTMCGIVGYIGTEQAAPIILDGLSKLEYRGYDSAGMAIFDGEKINTRKAVGRLKVLELSLIHISERYQFSSAYEQCGNHCRGTQRHYRELYSPEEKDAG